MTREGIDIVMAMDASASMLSKDFRPNRLEAAKEVAKDFVEDRPFDRVGVVVYEGESHPSALDHGPPGGHGRHRCPRDRAGRNRHRYGTGHRSQPPAEERRQEQGGHPHHRRRNNQGMIEPSMPPNWPGWNPWYTVGTIGKAKSPVRQRPDGSYIYDWVEVNIDEPTLKGIAAETGGRYFRATSGEKLQEIYTEIDTPKTHSTSSATTRNRRVRWFAGPPLLPP